MNIDTDKLKGRMMELKLLIPTPFISVYEFRFGKLSPKERNRVSNVWNLRITDEQILANFEIIAAEKK